MRTIGAYLDQQEIIVIVNCETVSEHEVKYTDGRLVVSVAGPCYSICDITNDRSLSLDRLETRQSTRHGTTDDTKLPFWHRPWPSPTVSNDSGQWHVERVQANGEKDLQYPLSRVARLESSRLASRLGMLHHRCP